VGIGFYTTAGYSIVCIEFVENTEKYIGYIEAAIGIGLLIGPIIGSFFYSLLGYLWSFIVFGIIIFITLWPIHFMLPAYLN
jgi:MFS family permease